MALAQTQKGQRTSLSLERENKFPPSLPSSLQQAKSNQNPPILILPHHTLSDTHPHSLSFQPSPEQIRAFYSSNTFYTSTSTLPSLTAWYPSSLISQLIVVCPLPSFPLTTNNDLDHLISMPSLHNIALVFHDYASKGHGPHRYLRPHLRSILNLERRRSDLNLRLKMVTCVFGRDDGLENLDLSGEGMKDVTYYLEILTEDEMEEVRLADQVVESYKGPASSCVMMLVEAGLGWEEAERVIENRVRRGVWQWIEDELLKLEEMQREEDVEMT